MPSVSVLMTVYNAERYVRTAIEGILAQTYSDFEFLIINDGSTDSSREIITSYSDPRIRLVDNEGNLGLTRSLNRGLQLAQGDLIARQDADDVSHPQRLEQQVCFLSNHPEVVLVGTQGRVIDEEGNYLTNLDRSQEHASIQWYHSFDNGFVHSAVMFRRNVIRDKFGGYDEAFLYCQDFDLWSKVLLDHAVNNLEHRLIDYRINSSSMSANMQTIAGEEGRRVIERNLTKIFGGQALTNEEVELISRFRVGIMEPSWKAFMDLFRRLLKEYQTLYPHATNSNDFWRTVARQYNAMAYRIVPPSRGIAVRVYARALRYHPALVFWLPWLRLLALVIFGGKVRKTYTFLRSYNWLSLRP